MSVPERRMWIRLVALGLVIAVAASLVPALADAEPKVAVLEVKGMVCHA